MAFFSGLIALGSFANLALLNQFLDTSTYSYPGGSTCFWAGKGPWCGGGACPYGHVQIKTDAGWRKWPLPWMSGDVPGDFGTPCLNSFITGGKKSLCCSIDPTDCFIHGLWAIEQSYDAYACTFRF
jgi:hypothetical protein